MLNMEMRRSGITASDMVALCGLDPHSSPYTVFLDKMGLLPERPDNPEMAEGRHFESVVASIYAARTGRQLYEVDTMRHPTRPWMVGTPDRLVVGEPRGVEIKNVFYKQQEWSETTPPLRHVIQCAWYMELLEYDAWDLAANLSRPPVRIYELPRDRELGQLLIETADRFRVDHILTMKPPPIDGSRAAQDYLQARFANPDAQMIDATEQDVQDYARLRAIEETVAPLAAEAEIISNRIRERIGPHRGLEGETFYFLWSKHKDSQKIDWEAVARGLNPTPLQIQEHTRIIAGKRTLRYYAKKPR